MFRNGTLKNMQWLDNGKILGIVQVNPDIVFQNFIRPIIRNGKMEIVSIGRVNYALLDAFITNAMNDYYAHISEEKNANLRMERTKEYQLLYQLWYQVNVAKQNQDPNLNSYYDDLIYQLYLLGYHER